MPDGQDQSPGLGKKHGGREEVKRAVLWGCEAAKSSTNLSGEECRNGDLDLELERCCSEACQWYFKAEGHVNDRSLAVVVALVL